MKQKLIALAAVATMALALSACGSGGSTNAGDAPIGGDVIAPVTMGVNELQGAEVELVVGQVLNIDTESLAVDSYEGEVADPAIAEFTNGRIDASAEFNPGVTALAEGTTQVVMVNEQGGIQALEFTVTVVGR